MRIEGITMLVHLDIKDPDLLPYAYDIISKAVNPAGVAAMGKISALSGTAC